VHPRFSAAPSEQFRMRRKRYTSQRRRKYRQRTINLLRQYFVPTIEARIDAILQQQCHREANMS